MARRPTPPDEPLREWRISVMRDKVHYLGRVVAPDEKAAIDRAMEEFGIEPARRFRVIACGASLSRRNQIRPRTLAGMTPRSDDASRARAEALSKQHERQKADAERMRELRRLRLARDAEVLKRTREIRRLRLSI